MFTAMLKCIKLNGQLRKLILIWAIFAIAIDSNIFFYSNIQLMITNSLAFLLLVFLFYKLKSIKFTLTISILCWSILNFSVSHFLFIPLFCILFKIISFVIMLLYVFNKYNDIFIEDL